MNWWAVKGAEDYYAPARRDRAASAGAQRYDAHETAVVLQPLPARRVAPPPARGDPRRRCRRTRASSATASSPRLPAGFEPASPLEPGGAEPPPLPARPDARRDRRRPASGSGPRRSVVVAPRRPDPRLAAPLQHGRGRRSPPRRPRAGRLRTGRPAGVRRPLTDPGAPAIRACLSPRGIPGKPGVSERCEGARVGAVGGGSRAIGRTAPRSRGLSGLADGISEGGAVHRRLFGSRRGGRGLHALGHLA